MRPRVSIIAGVYNGERFLTELLDSVLAQTCAEWECICVDDGSTDSSADILRAYAAKDARIRVLRRSNGGVGAARNTGLEASQAPFFMFADQDDRLLPRAVEKALSAIEASGADIVRFQSNRHGRRSPFVWERIFRRESAGGARFPPVTGGEDTAFLWDLELLGLAEAEIPDELYWNRPDPASFSRAASPKYVENVFAAYAAMADSARSRGIAGARLFAKMFPHVFWFSASVARRHSPGAFRSLLRGLAALLRGKGTAKEADRRGRGA